MAKLVLNEAHERIENHLRLEIHECIDDAPEPCNASLARNVA
jgi:hypothetical protein